MLQRLELQRLELQHVVLVPQVLMQLEQQYVALPPRHLHDEYVRRFLFPLQMRG
jgi:hypothetical protein